MQRKSLCAKFPLFNTLLAHLGKQIHIILHLSNSLHWEWWISTLRISVTLMSSCNEGDYGQWHLQHVTGHVLSHPLPQFYSMQISCFFWAWLQFMLPVKRSSFGELCETSCSILGILPALLVWTAKVNRGCLC